jgi:glycine C-acetyltransferase
MRTGSTKGGNDDVLGSTIDDIVHSTGRSVLARVQGVADWREARLRIGAWSWARTLDGPIGPRSTVRSDAGMASYGLNFVTQDPLSILNHPALFDAALDALQRHGPHTPGSPCFAGVTAAARILEAAMADFLGLEHVALFPSGWAAAFGALAALARTDDHVLIDEIAHPALRTGAAAATRHVHPYRHCDVDAVRAQLGAIRDGDAETAILVCTETLFAFESDGPDLAALHAACREHDAILIAACGHDLGTMGPGGTGRLGMEGVLGDVDLVVGSFAKVFAANGGFIAARSPDLKQWLRFAASSHAESNAIAPIQTAVAAEALRIVRSEEGAQRRADLARAVAALRRACGERALPCLGEPSAIVPIPIGATALARAAEALAAARGAFVTLLEPPFVAADQSRLALHVMAAHRPEHAREVVDLVATALDDARRLRAGDDPAVP